MEGIGFDGETLKNHKMEEGILPMPPSPLNQENT